MSYINVEEFAERLKWNPRYYSFAEILKTFPRADVVPRSELNDWIATAKENLVRITELEEEIERLLKELDEKNNSISDGGNNE